MARFEVVEELLSGPRARVRYAVVDRESRDLPVAHFNERADAVAHADKLNRGPLDWDEQEPWKDEWRDEP